MTKDKQLMLEKMLQDFAIVFGGKLGLYPHEQIHLESNPGAVPVA